MTALTPPDSLTVTNAAMVMDGGSLFLECVDGDHTLGINLDWSIDSRRCGCPQLSVGDTPIPRGSPEEETWLRLLEQAEVRSEPGPPGRDISPKALVLSDDIDDYLAAIRRGPEEATRHLIRELVARVRSGEYQFPSANRPAPAPRDPLEPLRALVARGARSEAIRWYRDHHPDAPLSEAVRVVDEALRNASGH